MGLKGTYALHIVLPSVRMAAPRQRHSWVYFDYAALSPVSQKYNKNKQKRLPSDNSFPEQPECTSQNYFPETNCSSSDHCLCLPYKLHKPFVEFAAAPISCCKALLWYSRILSLCPEPHPAKLLIQARFCKSPGTRSLGWPRPPGSGNRIFSVLCDPGTLELSTKDFSWFFFFFANS